MVRMNLVEAPFLGMSNAAAGLGDLIFSVMVCKQCQNMEFSFEFARVDLAASVPPWGYGMGVRISDQKG